MGVKRASKSDLMALAEELTVPQRAELEKKVDEVRAVLVAAYAASWAKQEQGLQRWAEKLRAEVFGRLDGTVKRLETKRAESDAYARTCVDELTQEFTGLKAEVEKKANELQQLGSSVRNQVALLPTQAAIDAENSRVSQMVREVKDLDGQARELLATLPGIMDRLKTQAENEHQERAKVLEARMQGFADTSQKMAREAVGSWRGEAKTLGVTQKTFDARLHDLEQQFKGMQALSGLIAKAK